MDLEKILKFETPKNQIKTSRKQVSNQKK
jgi:hypothetical protein